MRFEKSPLQKRLGDPEPDKIVVAVGRIPVFGHLGDVKTELRLDVGFGALAISYGFAILRPQLGKTKRNRMVNERMGLVVAESVLIGVMGGALGIGSAQGLLWVLTHTPGIRDALAGLGLSSLNLRPLVAGLGFANAVFLGFVAGFVPALVAYRARITDMLRTV